MDFLIENVLAPFNLQVISMLPTKFRVYLLSGVGGVGF